MDAPNETRLAGGNASDAVTRVGDTVRKPWQPTTDHVVGYLKALRDKGIDVPAHLGRDERGRQVLEFVPGRLAMSLDPLDAETVAAVGRLVRSIHDASEGLPVPADWPVAIPAATPDLICHNDLASWNLVVDGDRLVFIDWDGAGPSTRLWDLAYAAVSFGHLFPGSEVDGCVDRLRALLEGYDADRTLRRALPTTLARRSRAMHDLLLRGHRTGEQPWGRMYAEGHGRHWLATTTFIESHEPDWTAACT